MHNQQTFCARQDDTLTGSPRVAEARVQEGDFVVLVQTLSDQGPKSVEKAPPSDDEARQVWWAQQGRGKKTQKENKRNC
jgi:hypothetical protein